MVELTPGSQNSIYQNLIQQAIGKSSYKSAASYLLNCFYMNEELVGMNLTGANGKPHPDMCILESKIVKVVLNIHDSVYRLAYILIFVSLNLKIDSIVHVF